MRNVRAAHRKSFLGLFWLVIPSIVNTAVWVLLKRSQVIQFNEDPQVPYILFAITGILFWHNFRDAMEIPFNLMEKYQDIIKNLSFNHLSIMGAASLEAIFNTGVRCALLLVVYLMYGIECYWTAFLFIYPLIVLLMLGFALSMWIMPLYLMYRDVPRLFGYATQFGFLFTPIVYQMPEQGVLKWIVLINPVSAPLMSLRDFILYGETEYIVLTNIVFLIALVLFVSGIKVYKITCRRIVERI